MALGQPVLRRSGSALRAKPAASRFAAHRNPNIHERLALEAIIDYLKLHGEQLDADIAEALGLPLERVRAEMQKLSANGDVMMCLVTRYREGTKIEGWACRVAGFIPPAAPGRRPSPAKS